MECLEMPRHVLAKKLSVNLLLMVQVIAFGEAVALAEKGGVDRERVA